MCGASATRHRRELLDSDLAAADAIMHCHDMGSRLLELCLTRGKRGQETAKLLLRLLDGEAVTADALGFAEEAIRGANTIDYLHNISLINAEGKLESEYRLVGGDTIRAHQRRWGLSRRKAAVAVS